MKNILVTIEFEAHSQALIDKAAELAEKYNSKIWLIHVAAPDPDFVGYEVGPGYIRNSRADQLRSEHRKLQQFAVELQNAELNAEALLVQGATADTILEEAEKLACDLIIIGHHTHGWFYKVFNQSTDIAVLDRAKIPVLIMPQLE